MLIYGFIGGIIVYFCGLLWGNLIIAQNNISVEVSMCEQPIKNNIANQSKPVSVQTAQKTIDLVVGGLVHIGMKRAKAKSLVAKMCKNSYYQDEQKLFEDCFPHINS
jgi:hypothetical protein